MKSDLIERQDAIDAFHTWFRDGFDEDRWWNSTHVLAAIEGLPSAQPDYQEVLGWLLAYHTMSFTLHGRYLPHEVISWLINDFTKEFIAERGQDDLGS